MKQLKAIQTVYKGYRFRSRLEARWAVFFDSCGVSWEYEPEGYDLGRGIYYLPDFLLHEVQLGCFSSDSEFSDLQNLYVEVKGQMSPEDSKKIAAFYKAGLTDIWIERTETPILVLGNIPAGDTLAQIQSFAEKERQNSSHWKTQVFSFGTIDGMDCLALPCVNREGYLELFGYATEYNHAFIDAATTERAYCHARQARFEHGETPSVRKERSR